MGTSASFRAPAVPRWQAFTTALKAGLPLERVQSELFNAGADWEVELEAPAVAAYALAVFDAHSTLPRRLNESDRPEHALQALLAEARTASQGQPASAASPMAERALLGLLCRLSAGESSLTLLGPGEAAQRFTAARGTPGELLCGYLGELLGQYARHVTAREAGRLTEGEGGMSVAATRALTRRIAAGAEGVGLQASVTVGDRDAVRSAWQSLVRDAFARGRRLPERRA
jgi:hypothetical protein